LLGESSGRLVNGIPEEQEKDFLCDYHNILLKYKENEELGGFFNPMKIWEAAILHLMFFLFLFFLG
jgi:hypothetical protein